MKAITVVISILGSATLSPAAVGISHIVDLGNQFHVYQTFEKSDYTGFMFDSIGGSWYQYGGSYLDEGLDLYSVVSGNTFTPAAITNGDFSGFSFGSYYNFPSISYIGLVTPSRDAGLTGYLPAYGWARVSSSGGVLTILDHAIDYSGNGLIVGTTTVVPEPCVTGLIAIGLGCFFIRRCRPAKWLGA